MSKRGFKVRFVSPFTGAEIVTSYATREAANKAIKKHRSGERMGKPGRAKILPPKRRPPKRSGRSTGKRKPAPPKRHKLRPALPKRRKPRPAPPKRRKPRPALPKRRKPRPAPPKRRKPRPAPPKPRKPRPAPPKRRKPRSRKPRTAPSFADEIRAIVDRSHSMKVTIKTQTRQVGGTTWDVFDGELFEEVPVEEMAVLARTVEKKFRSKYKGAVRSTYLGIERNEEGDFIGKNFITLKSARLGGFSLEKEINRLDPKKDSGRFGSFRQFRFELKRSPKGRMSK